MIYLRSYSEGAVEVTKVKSEPSILRAAVFNSVVLVHRWSENTLLVFFFLGVTLVDMLGN